MASIKDAFEESFQDDKSILKYIVFAIPVYCCFYLFSQGNWTTFWPVASLTFLLLYGILIECTTNVRNGKNIVLPSFNIFIIVFNGIKGTIALGPSIAINCLLASLINQKLLPTFLTDTNILMVIQGIIWALFGSFILTGYLCYAKNFKIADAYNLKTIYTSCVGILVSVLFMLPQVLLANIILLVPVLYIVWVFLGLPHPVAEFYCCMVVIFNLALCGNYLAQVDYENICTKLD